jgi:seryl-tRNA synthetase
MHEHRVWLKEGLQVPDFLIGDLQSRLAYVDEDFAGVAVAPDGKSIRLMLRRVPDAGRQAQIESRIERVIQAMVPGAVRPRQKVLEDSLDRPVPYGRDPLPELLEKGEVSREGTGFAVLGPVLSGLVDYFESQFIGVARSFGAAGYRFPALMSAELLDHVEYFRSFPHSLSFVCHMREDLDAIEGFAQSAHCEDGVLQMDRQALSSVTAVLSPAVCFHYYGTLSGKRLRQGVCATGVGSCFRYESSNMMSLERLWNFSMREIIYVGPKDFVLDNREAARKKVADLLEDWGLAYRVEGASDPFFIGDFKKQVAFQGAFQLKYEIRAAIPHRAGTLAVGSYNFHQDFFGRHLDIAMEDGTPVCTGCVAFGLERMAYAFVAQYGLDRSAWPEAVRRGVA